jgi:hypothetical protein
VVTALVHLAFIVVLVGGAFVVYCKPRLWKFHLPAVVAMTVVTLAGADCPLTAIENWFRRRAGWAPYGSGFVSHYLVEPWHGAGITLSIRIAIIAIWIVPNVAAYAAVYRWQRQRRAVTLSA